MNEQIKEFSHADDQAGWSLAWNRSVFEPSRLTSQALEAVNEGNFPALRRIAENAEFCVGEDSDPASSEYQQIIDFCHAYLPTSNGDSHEATGDAIGRGEVHG